MKHRLVFGLLLVLAVFSQTARAEVTEIHVMAEWAAGTHMGDLFRRFVDEFNALHPDIHVVVDVGNRQKLVVEYAAGVAPDVFIGRGTEALEIGGPDGMLLPLDQFIDGPQGVPRDEFAFDLWSFSTVDGKVYQVAVDSNERALFVNNGAAEQSGIDTSQKMRDWNDLLEWARKLTIRSGEEVISWGFNANHGLGGDRWHWVWLNDGELFTPDGTGSLLHHPNTVEAVRFAADLIHTYGVSPLPGAVGGHQAAFLNGTFNMILTNSTFMSSLENQDEVDFQTVAGPPGVGKTGGRYSGATGSNFVILDTTRHAEAAWEFVRFMTYERGNEFAEARGGIPYLLEGLRSGKFLTPEWAPFAESILTFNPRTVSNVKVEAGRWGSIFESAWSSVLRGEVAPEVAMMQASEQLDALLAEAAASR